MKSADLPTLEAVLQKGHELEIRENLRTTAVIYVHHAVQTSTNVIDAIIRLGADPRNIFVIGKSYSECPAVVKAVMQLGVYYQPCSAQLMLGEFSRHFLSDVEALWSRVESEIIRQGITKVLILDHGGRTLANVPEKIKQHCTIIGVEKTTGGLIELEKKMLSFPIINLAQSAAKKILESPLIVEEIMDRLSSLFSMIHPSMTCGIVGFGAIGQALATKLMFLGHRVIIYDNHVVKTRQQHQLSIAKNLSSLVTQSDYIFGCTGRNFMESNKSLIQDLEHSVKSKTLVSCSSEDKEFLSLLQSVQKKYDENSNKSYEKFQDIIYHTTAGATIRIVKGGFPANFDRAGELIDPNDIQLTRSLVLSSVLQAIKMMSNSCTLKADAMYSLNSQLQVFVAKQWFQDTDHRYFSKTLMSQFSNTQWIEKNSDGIHYELEDIQWK